MTLKNVTRVEDSSSLQWQKMRERWSPGREGAVGSVKVEFGAGKTYREDVWEWRGEAG